jgi:hypothetical protein
MAKNTILLEKAMNFHIIMVLSPILATKHGLRRWEGPFRNYAFVVATKPDADNALLCPHNCHAE